MYGCLAAISILCTLFSFVQVSATSWLLACPYLASSVRLRMLFDLSLYFASCTFGLLSVSDVTDYGIVSVYCEYALYLTPYSYVASCTTASLIPGSVRSADADNSEV